jgi:hypothetical protein
MPHAALDLHFHSHPKILNAGNAAVGLYARALSYCADNLTDGFVPKRWAAMAGTPATCKKLESVDLWVKVEGGYQIPGYLKHNLSRAGIEARSERGRELADARWAKKRPQQTDENTMRSALEDAVQDAVGNPMRSAQCPSPIPNPIPLPTPEVEADFVKSKSALDLGEPGSEKERAARALLDEIGDRDDATGHFIAATKLPAAAYFAAIEALQERRANTKKPKLVSEKKYVLSTLHDWKRDGRYGPKAAA